ncbi:MAG: hypothetical protein WA816_00815 [Bacteroidales bacterium]
MSGCKCNISLIIVLVSLFSIQAYSQQINYRDSLAEYNSQKVNLKPKLYYSVGSTFIIVPHLGTVTGFTFSPFLSIPLSPKLSIDGGIIAGRFYSALGNSDPESAINGAFNELSVYGSATYHFNSQLNLYGSGIKQLTGTSPFNYLPKSSYSIGSSYNFGNFSIGVTLQISKWNNDLGPLPFSQGFYAPYDQRPGTLAPFGR